MADSSVAITAGSGTNIDTRTESVNGDHRQVVVLGDPIIGTGVAPVDSTNGLAVHVVPALPAGANNIGKVDINSLPALPAGTNAIGKLAANSGVVIGDTNAVSVIPGVGATSLGKAEDAPHASGDTGVMVLAVRDDSGATLAGTTGDYIPLTTDAAGSLRVTGTASVQHPDDTTHTAGDVGNLNLAVRRDANTTLASSDGNYVPLQVNTAGALKVAITSGAGSGGTSIADAGAFTKSSTSITPIGGIYETSPTALTNGQAGIIELDSSGNVLTHEQYGPVAEDNSNGVIAQQIKPVAGSTYSPSLYAPMTQVTKANIKNAAGNVFSTLITNANAAVRYFQLHNKATAPAGADVPLISIPVPAGTVNNPGQLILDDAFFSKGGRYFSLGIGWAISTTFATFTDSATNTDHIVVTDYI